MSLILFNKNFHGSKLPHPRVFYELRPQSLLRSPEAYGEIPLLPSCGPGFALPRYRKPLPSDD